jgi:anti-sigma regulatory factor (Ser/Thr protein kinase)
VRPKRATRDHAGTPAFEHDALLFAGLDELASGVRSYVLEGLAANQPAVVCLPAIELAAVYETLTVDLAASEREMVSFHDTKEVGAHPGRLLSFWHDVATHSAGHGTRAVGKPTRHDANPAEIDETLRLEHLFNLQFSRTPGISLLCSYDTAALDEATVGAALQCHARRCHGATSTPVSERQWMDATALLGGLRSLPEPDQPVAVDIEFDGDTSVSACRNAAAAEAQRLGFDARRAGDIQLTVSELVTNSILHGGGHGRLRMWSDASRLVIDVSDQGALADPLVGRIRPSVERQGGRGLWLVNQLSDLVRMRADADSTVIRSHFRFA